jgi:hypothetical protein
VSVNTFLLKQSFYVFYSPQGATGMFANGQQLAAPQWHSRDHHAVPGRRAEIVCRAM